MQHTAQHFDSLFSRDVDPWQFRSRWYELRKRALTLACLPQLRYADAYEPGCANGELSVALASRCDRLMVSDGSSKAVALATSRLADVSNVQVRQHWVPQQWPTKTFDLIVCSEFGFYLNAEDLDGLADRISLSLRAGGTVVVCHWRRIIEGCEFSGDEVHQRLLMRMVKTTELTQVCQVLEPDMRLEVWCRDERSVAQREGFA